MDAKQDGNRAARRNSGPGLAAQGLPAAYSVREFCRAHGISRALLYLLWRDGRGPRKLKAGRRTLITAEAAAEWRGRQEGTPRRPFDPSLDIPALPAAASKLPNLRAVLVDSIEGQLVRWGEAVTGSAREILAAAESTVDPQERGAVEEAAEFLRAELKKGQLPAKEIYTAAEQAGHSRASILRAKLVLGIKPEKIGLRGPWSWSLTPNMPKSIEDAQPFSQSTSGRIVSMFAPHRLKVSNSPPKML